VSRCSARQRIDHQEEQTNVNAPACDDGRIRRDGQELIIRNYCPTACAGLRTSPAKHLGFGPASTTAVSPSRSHGSGKLPVPGRPL
jgi:hypothetical protein